ncbi:MAG: outer membrane protein assembly factor BamC [Pseudohongiellaceae bacterium]
MLRAILLVIYILGLSSCRFIGGESGYFRDRQGDYLRAVIEPDMRVPGNLDRYTLDQLYVIPSQVFEAADDFSSSIPRPKPLDTNRAEGVVIQRIGGEAWIVIAASPQQVWPRVRDFWLGRNQQLDYENPVEGIMETTWQDGMGDLTRLEKFRVRIEPGLRAGSSEIYIYMQGRLRTTPEPALPAWPAASSNDGTGYTVLEQISQYLADRTDIYSSSSASLLAGSLAGESKSSFSTSASGDAELNLRIGMTRAWAQVAQALERAEIVVLDSNRDQGVYNVQFAGLGIEGDTPGLFSRLFGNDDEGESDLPQFSISLETTGNGVRVTALSETDSDEAARLAEELLQTVLDNLG